MSPRTARSVSTALVGGVAALVFFRTGLYFWVALTAWAALTDAPAGADSFKHTLSSLLFGAVMGWVAVVASLLVPVPAAGWLWVPRAAAAILITLYFLDAAARVELFSRRSASLLGYASVLGATYLAVSDVAGMGRFLGARLSNPLVSVIVALLGGAVVSWIADGVTKSLAKA